MAWRFKASKYKNAAPIVPKPEVCVRDICVGSYQTYGNNIAASAAFMAFNWEHAGSSLAVLPIDDCGRKSKTMPLLHGHTDTVTDLGFSPFHDGLLATGSQDCLVNLFNKKTTAFNKMLLDFDFRRQKFGLFRKRDWTRRWRMRNALFHINNVVWKRSAFIRLPIVCCTQRPPVVLVCGTLPCKRRLSVSTYCIYILKINMRDKIWKQNNHL